MSSVRMAMELLQQLSLRLSNAYELTQGIRDGETED